MSGAALPPRVQIRGFDLSREDAERLSRLKDSADWGLYRRLLTDQAASSEALLLTPEADARSVDYHRGLLAGIRYFQQFVEDVAPGEYASLVSRASRPTRGTGSTTP